MGTTRIRVRAFIFLLGSVLIAAALAAQQQEPTFKGGIRTVAVYATVTGANGRLVPDLTRDVFSIFDNGKKQELSLFANDIQPITVVMMLDRSGSMVGNFELVEQAAEQFVNVMLPADKARIGSFSNRIQVDPRDFTSDHDELLKILRNDLQEEGPTPLWNAVNVGITALLHQQGRRVVLVFTDGMDAPMNFSNNNSSLKSVMKRAEEEDVMVYAIGLASSMPSSRGRGTGGGGYPGGRGAGFPGGSGRGGRGGFGGGGRGGFGIPPAGVTDHPDEGLPKIAAATGGGYFELTTTADLVATFQKVADELHHQYALGFTPTSLDGKMHTLDVRIAGQGMTVRARKSYLARNER
ncbi:MAG: VWA domain-containing protein [Acidobacteria bacterium]|nr:VWA domain-containing protein [Acidobacteriota bacterium]